MFRYFKKIYLLLVKGRLICNLRDEVNKYVRVIN